MTKERIKELRECLKKLIAITEAVTDGIDTMPFGYSRRQVTNVIRKAKELSKV